MVGYIFGGNTGETPESIRRKREAIAEMLTGQRTPQNWGEGWGAVLKGIGSWIEQNRLDKAEASGRAGLADKIKSLITGTNPDIFGSNANGNLSGNIPMSEGGNQVAATTPGGGNMNYRDAIASIESKGSGNYRAVGPTHDKLGRALGRYQIMEANIGPWSQAALGQAITPDEFMANPDLQDKIFDHRFGQYVEKYGPEGAAQAWLGGEGGVGKTGRKDSLGTSIGSYGKRFMSALGPDGGAIGTPEEAINYVSPARGNIPMGADPIMQQNMTQPSLTDEVAAYEQTPEYRAQFPGAQQGQGQQAIGDQISAVQQPMQGSQQLADASGGMMPALNGGQPASAEQVAQAQQVGQQQQQGMSGPTLQQLYEISANPWLSGQERSVVNMLFEQKMREQQSAREEQQWRGRQDYQQKLRQSDPAYGLELEKSRAELDALRQPKVETTDDIREYNVAKPQGYQGTLQDFMLEMKRAGASQQNVTIGEGDKFYEALDKKNAETFAAISEAGVGGRSRLGQLGQLDALLKSSPVGAGANIKLWLGDMGINTDGLSDLQATRALIERMVPEQRQPGSGPMSDADIAMYRRSLPSVINQPGGNDLIIGTAKAIAEYDIRMGEIADMVADREISAAEGRKMIRGMENPLESYSERLGALRGQNNPPTGVDEDLWKYMTPEERRLFQ